jgi:hypothetical protein
MGGSDLFHGWVGKGLRIVVKMVSSSSYILGVIVLMVGDIFMGAQVLPGMFTAASGPWTKVFLPWLIAAGTSAAQMGAWALVLKFEKGQQGISKVFTIIIGGVVALAISLVDTFIDALYAQTLVFGSAPTVFPPAELSALGGFHLGFWILFVLFGLISLAGEPVALFMLFAADTGEEVPEEDEDDDWGKETIQSSVPAPAG